MQTEATTATSVRSSGPSSSRHHRSSRGGLRVDEEMNVTTSKQRQNPSSTHHSSRTSTSAGRSRPHPQAPPSNGQHSSQQQSTPNGSQQPQSESTSHRSTSQDVSARRNESGSYPQRRPAYLLHRDLVIGKGSYGQVCIASRGETEGGKPGKRKKFACKCVVLRSDPKYIAKLQEEVNVLRELRGHENVIRLYDVFCVDNELFIITELGRGGDLFHLLTTHPKHGVTEAYAAKTVSQMLSAVAFLHSKNICHRDLKLENWVLESGKDVWSPLKLIDFGLSTHFTPGHRLSRVVGSSYYVAPEVLKKSYTEACDLWSLGVIVYMLLSGAPPFYGKTDEAIKASIVNGEYTFPHELFRDVSDEAMAFVSSLLSYNQEFRYTAEQALSHPWLAANSEPVSLQRCKDGARGGHERISSGSSLHEPRPEPMQM
mmetsp:Transcript_20395/g.46280  ORF Transcript_20395/g.46280 Transcript_20395/m.46280 type:complete len:428 (-) Transcript_20395:297-1580(-)|eukprot:CAMPEP_0113306706 /NCGR_PEP_ID=MMETSP0010_2-20120614/5852_1 /TAXON_ID=216773 ORGANISM="Corethron hystrix, Strain 308" /NCGR_SAMPLE_ID=MMETSP0010_2 /ASSEMBLY_ACC=CAM_ASM_000155 /LENGTH=427 /DNA_ID=CAMNT_0000161431 /DNA_START=487 /DNA_END=1770 /DNA_ORIENTATION=+ /assembly_acc=CAM_ASM_000155